LPIDKILALWYYYVKENNNMLKEYEVYLETLKIDKSKETYRSYKHILENFFNSMKIESIEDIKNMKSEDIQNYINHMIIKKEGEDQNSINKAKATANAHLRVIKAYMNWLVSKNYIPESPANKVARFKEAQTIATVFTKEERDKAILNTKNKAELQLTIAILFYTGIRREEAVNIKLSDIKDGVLLVHGKGNKERQIPLNPFLQELIKKCLLQRKHKSEYLLASARGGHKISTTSLYKRVKTACEIAGIDQDKIEKLSPHSVRRSLACFLLMDGASSSVIQNVLGHANYKTTERYIRPAIALAARKTLLEQEPPSWWGK